MKIGLVWIKCWKYWANWYPNESICSSKLDIIDEIIRRASYDAGLIKPIKTIFRIADLKARTEYGESFEKFKINLSKTSKKKFKVIPGCHWDTSWLPRGIFGCINGWKY